MAVAKRKPSVGDLAPDFKLPGSDGKTHSLSERPRGQARRGHRLVSQGVYRRLNQGVPLAP
jgi:hypothetical protein